MNERVQLVAPPAPAKKPGKPRVLQCPACGGAITLRAVGLSVNVGCTQCGSLLDVASEEVRILRKAREHQHRPRIPLGTRGVLEGITWEVIGLLQKSSIVGVGERYSWDEYLLFNPYQGFRFLTEAQGHWTLYQVVKGQQGEADTAGFDLFFQGKAEVDYVLGEFYWRVKKGDKAQLTDSIKPPYVRSVEKTGDEIVTSLGRYLPAADVSAAFGILPDLLPKAIGVAANQPSPYAAHLPSIVTVTATAVAVATAIQFVQASTARDQLLASDNFTLTADNRNDERISEPITLGPEQANVCMSSHASLRNNWAELNATLLNESTLERRSIQLGMEFYSGFDGGEHWSEGSQSASGCFPAVPGGSYRLILDADAGELGWGGLGTGQTMGYQLSRDVPIWSNWLALLLALLPYPLYLWFRHHSFEYARWSESDYMPAFYASIQQSMGSEDE
jgi:hypothetical protein